MFCTCQTLTSLLCHWERASLFLVNDPVPCTTNTPAFSLANVASSEKCYLWVRVDSENCLGITCHVFFILAGWFSFSVELGMASSFPPLFGFHFFRSFYHPAISVSDRIIKEWDVSFSMCPIITEHDNSMLQLSAEVCCNDSHNKPWIPIVAWLVSRLKSSQWRFFSRSQLRVFGFGFSFGFF